LVLSKKDNYTGIILALVTVVIWSGNYVVARGISSQVPPITLAFLRWGTASICILPIAWKKFVPERRAVVKHGWYLFTVAFTGICLFNTFIYIAGHYTAAINLALLGTTSAPIFAIILAMIFLGERMTGLRFSGMLLCITGILLLLSRGSWSQLGRFRFETGDLWILASAFAFAIYNTLIRKKPAGISPLTLLMVIFVTGALILLPACLLEMPHYPPIHWTRGIVEAILYLGIGNSVIGFLCWNLAISRIGAGRTVLFANLIPIFSTIEAVIFLGEPFTTIHLLSGVLVIGGLTVANLKK